MTMPRENGADGPLLPMNCPRSGQLTGAGGCRDQENLPFAMRG